MKEIPGGDKTRFQNLSDACAKSGSLGKIYVRAVKSTNARGLLTDGFSLGRFDQEKYDAILYSSLLFAYFNFEPQVTP